MFLSSLTNFAARTYTYTRDYSGSSISSSDSAAIAGIGLLAAFMIIFFAVVFSYVVMSLFYMIIFKKAGLKASTAWIPFYNTWKFLELGGQPGWAILLALIPFVGWIATYVFQAIAAYNIGLKLNKSGAFVLIYVFFSALWYLILGFDDSKWDDSLGKASLAEGTILGYATESEVKEAETTEK